MTNVRSVPSHEFGGASARNKTQIRSNKTARGDTYLYESERGGSGDGEWGEWGEWGEGRNGGGFGFADYRTAAFASTPVATSYHQPPSGALTYEWTKRGR